MTGCVSLFGVGSWCWWAFDLRLLSCQIHLPAQMYCGEHVLYYFKSSFSIFGIFCLLHGSCVHRAVITGTVSSVAPSVSAHPAEPQDLFQMSGSNINSWTVTNCVSHGIVARARELVNGSERRHRDGITVRLQYDQCCFALKNQWRETTFSLHVATCCSSALKFYCTFQVFYTKQCATCSSEGVGGNFIDMNSLMAVACWLHGEFGVVECCGCTLSTL